ncbi:MAG: amidohydrolase family protein [Alphaproteobacteria bacterium]|jgi:cytosine deaminase|nr:amidohydrolase family protein [Alphaproteobacteria bacterium]MDP6588015.1 amidohydrolase family protein [Alphaproteobacteria bacterium]MDP6818151.1 amidohydrolase family protein [Alphaproteobacteria bacterium]
MDLILRGATLADGRSGIDIAVKDGKIAALEAGIGAAAGREIDVTGRLVTPPFVDPHFHMDGTLTYGYPRYNESGTLLEGIALWRDLKPSLSHDWYVERALEYCDWAVGHGLLAIRSHVDTTDPTLGGVAALLEVRERIKDYIDLQLVAFPQDGYLRSPIGVENMAKALDMGVDVIGGIPHFERTMEEGAESMRRLCALAAERGLRVDIHCDETDDPLSRHIETLAAETVRLGLEGRVAGSHLSSMHSMDDYYVSKLIPLMIEADIQVIANPTANMLLMGRHDSYPKRRGMTRVKELMAAGLNVSFGQDSVMDAFGSLNTGDVLDAAHMAVHAGQLSGRDEMIACFRAVTENSARAMDLEGYGLEVGCNADIVVLQATDAVEAIRLRPPRLYVIRRGRIIAESPAHEARLDLPGRPETTDFARHTAAPK